MDRSILKKVIEQIGISQAKISSGIGMEPSTFSLKINNKENSKGILQDFNIEEIEKLVILLENYLNNSNSIKVAGSLLDMVRSGSCSVNSLSSITHSLIYSGNYIKLIKELILLEHYGHKAMGVQIINGSKKLQVGGEVFLNARIMPDEAVNKNVIWTSSNQDILSIEPVAIEFNVSPASKIFGKSKGNAVIKVETLDGKFADFFEIEVYVPVHKIEITSIPINNRIKKGQVYQLVSKVTPDNAITSNIKWSSSNSRILSVDPRFGIITANNKGSAIITMETEDGKYKDIVKLTVFQSAIPFIALIVSVIILCSAILFTILNNNKPVINVMNEVTPAPSITNTEKNTKLHEASTNAASIVSTYMFTPESTKESDKHTPVPVTIGTSPYKSTKSTNAIISPKQLHTQVKSSKIPTPLVSDYIYISELNDPVKWEIKNKNNSIITLDSEKNGRSGGAIKADFQVKGNGFAKIAADLKMLNNLTDDFNTLRLYYKCDCQNSILMTLELIRSTNESKNSIVNIPFFEGSNWDSFTISDQPLNDITGIEIRIENLGGQADMYSKGSVYICDFSATR